MMGGPDAIQGSGHPLIGLEATPGLAIDQWLLIMKSWIKQDMTKHKQLPALAFVALATQLKTASSPSF